MNEDRTFLGRGWSFPPALDKDGAPTRMATYEENNTPEPVDVLSTSPGERVHRYRQCLPLCRHANGEIGEGARQSRRG